MLSTLCIVGKLEWTLTCTVSVVEEVAVRTVCARGAAIWRFRGARVTVRGTVWIKHRLNQFRSGGTNIGTINNLLTYGNETT